MRSAQIATWFVTIAGLWEQVLNPLFGSIELFPHGIGTAAASFGDLGPTETLVAEFEQFPFDVGQVLAQQRASMSSGAIFTRHG